LFKEEKKKRKKERKKETSLTSKERCTLPVELNISNKFSFEA
jgi:hypothetical protein